MKGNDKEHENDNEDDSEDQKGENAENNYTILTRMKHERKI